MRVSRLTNKNGNKKRELSLPYSFYLPAAARSRRTVSQVYRHR